MRCVRDGSENPLCFFFKNIKIAANSPTRSCQEERRSNLQGHAHTLATRSINKEFKKINPLQKMERIYQTKNLKKLLTKLFIRIVS
jgi:hypothetical protein